MIIAAPFLGAAEKAYAAPDGCEAGVESDFNGDGWSDTVIGDPFATVAGQADAGRIVVLYGDADNRVGEGGRDVLWQGEEQVTGVPETGDRFGTALSAGDVDCDGYTDLVVGTPYEDFGATVDSGYVQVIWGSASGLGMETPSHDRTQASFGQPIRAHDHFGYAVDLLEDVSQGGTPAPDAYVLAIGVPGADVGGDNDAGAVAVRVAFDGGSESYWLTQDTPGVPGAAEPGDRFGSAVSCNFLTDDDTVDCAIGAPKEDIGSKKDAGTVIVINNIYFDDDLTGDSLDQNAPGVPGVAEAGDQYGRSLDTIVVGGTARLAVGAPGEDVGSVKNAGLVQLFSWDGDDPIAGTALTQNTPGVADSAQSGDIFGDQVAWSAPGPGDAQTRLAVSATKEDVGSASQAGMVQVFRMSNLGAEQTYTQATSGIAGGPGDGDHFGRSLAVVAGVSEKVLLVGVPDDSANSTGMVNVIPLTAGTPRFWKPGAGGIVSIGSGAFGASLASVTSGAE